MEYIYLTSLLVGVGMLIWLKLFDVRKSVIQYLNLITVIVSAFGYYFLSISRNLEEAEFAQIIGYVGGAFLPLLYLCTMPVTSSQHSSMPKGSI